jgi:hypothetical protein
VHAVQAAAKNGVARQGSQSRGAAALYRLLRSNPSFTVIREVGTAALDPCAARDREWARLPDIEVNSTTCHLGDFE